MHLEMNYRLELINQISDREAPLRSNVELFYVVEGNAAATVEGKTHWLLKNEILLIDFRSRYEIQFGYDTVLARLQFDYFELLQMTGKNRWNFQCDTASNHSKSHYDLRHAFFRMLRAHIIGERKLEERSAFYDLLSILTREYVKKETGSNGHLDDLKMDGVLLFLNLHYKEKITLDDLCREFFYSVSTFTRNFRKKTGMSLVQYLNELRVAAAEEELCTTEHSVTDIALNHGFSDIAAFHKVFKKRMGLPPLQYRKMEQENRRVREERSEEIQKAQQRYLKEAEEELAVERGQIFSRAVFDARQSACGEKVWTKAFGVADGADLLDAEYQKQLLMLKGNIDFRYIRIAGLFSERMAVRKYPGSMELDFSRIDAAIDFLVTNQILPILELSGEKLEIEGGQGNTALYLKRRSGFFVDYEDYAAVLKRFLEHVVVRYTSGFARYQEWIWEINYDSSRFSREEYLKQFQLVAGEVRKWSSKSRVGGSGCLISCFQEAELKYFVENGWQPDFFSVKAYPYEAVEERRNVLQLVRTMDSGFLARRTRELRETLDRNGCKELPIWYMGWNLSLSDKNIWNDSFQKAAKMMGVITELTGLVDLAVYDAVSDLGCDVYENRTLFGGRGILSRDGIEKPIAMMMTDLEFMTGNIAYQSDHAIFSSMEPNHLGGICFNDKDFNFSYYQKPEELLTEEELPDLFENQDILEHEIQIRSLANGVYRIKLARISEKSSVLWRLGMMGKEAAPDIGDIQVLRRVIFPEISTLEKTVKEHQLVFHVRLLPNETLFVNLYPIRLD